MYDMFVEGDKIKKIEEKREKGLETDQFGRIGMGWIGNLRRKKSFNTIDRKNIKKREK